MTPYCSEVNSIIQQAIFMNASDIHLEPMEDIMRVRFRIDGMLKQVMDLQSFLSGNLSRIKIMADGYCRKRLPQDGESVEN